MSAIAILDYGGANELFNQMSALAQKGREDYQLYYEEEAPNGNSDIDPMVPSLLQSLGQKRQKQEMGTATSPPHMLFQSQSGIQSISILLIRTSGYRVGFLGTLNNCHWLDTYTRIYTYSVGGFIITPPPPPPPTHASHPIPSPSFPGHASSPHPPTDALRVHTVTL